MSQDLIERSIKEGDQLLLCNCCEQAFEKYEQAINLLAAENTKTKRSKMIGSFAGWTAGILTGGIGLEDLIIIPGVSKGVQKVLGVNDEYLTVALQSICYRQIDCVMRSEQLLRVVQKEIMLQRFAILFACVKPSRALETVLDLYLPEMSIQNPFDRPEVSQSPISILIDEVRSGDAKNADNSYLLYSYLLRTGDNSDLYRELADTYGYLSRDHTTSSDQKHSNTQWAQTDSSQTDYHAILGLDHSASKEEIKDAYRDLIKKYHPDRFASLSHEFQELAHKRARLIIEAYEALTGGKTKDNK